MLKVDWETAFSNTTFFIEDSLVESYYENVIEERANEIANKIAILRDDNGVKKFIKNDKDSLSVLITLLGVTGERFNRIVSMIRANHGHVFEGEWKFDSNMRNHLLENNAILNDVCELFTNGYSSSKFRGAIPRLVLKKFTINKDILERISNMDFLKELVQAKLDTEYNTKYRIVYHDAVMGKVKPLAEKYGLEVFENVTPQGCTYPATVVLKSGSKSIVTQVSDLGIKPIEPVL